MLPFVGLFIRFLAMAQRGIFWKDMAVLSDDFQNVNLLIRTFWLCYPEHFLAFTCTFDM